MTKAQNKVQLETVKVRRHSDGAVETFKIPRDIDISSMSYHIQFYRDEFDMMFSGFSEGPGTFSVISANDSNGKLVHSDYYDVDDDDPWIFKMPGFSLPETVLSSIFDQRLGEVVNIDFLEIPSIFDQHILEAQNTQYGIEFHLCREPEGPLVKLMREPLLIDQ